MTWNVSPVMGDTVSGGGSGPRPWWSFPKGPQGPPKQVAVPGACYRGVYVAESDEWYYTLYPCPPLFSRTGIPDPP